MSFSIETPHSATVAGLLVYRPPDSESAELIELYDLIADLSLRYANFIVLGDFNVHVDNVKCPLAVQLLDSLLGLNLPQLVTLPTHKAGHVLDLIFTNILTLKVADPEPVLWSDHYLIFFFLWSQA